MRTARHHHHHHSMHHAKDMLVSAVLWTVFAFAALLMLVYAAYTYNNYQMEQRYGMDLVRTLSDKPALISTNTSNENTRNRVEAGAVPDTGGTTDEDGTSTSTGTSVSKPDVN